LSQHPNLLRSASELRIVLGQLVRRLRLENRLPLSHAAVLARLDREGPATTSALADAERMRPQSMGQTVSELLAGGLVARVPDPVDRRQVLIELTDEGRAMLAEDRARRDGWLAETIASELSPEEQRLLVEAVGLLGRLAEVATPAGAARAR
jgi:DNA-binding MarR family transcriptional regulator